MTDDPSEDLSGYDVLTWYDELSGGYDELYLEEQLSKYRVLAGAVLLKSVRGNVRVVLDVGCGTGGLAAFLKSLGVIPFYVGLDLSPSMCESTRERLKNLSVLGDVVVGDLSSPPFRDRVADLVLSITVLTCRKSLESDVGSLSRMVRNGGYLIYTVLCSSGVFNVSDGLCGFSVRLSPRELLCVSLIHA
ncbi:MAG: class I SAM-dependent methyltransferase [Zestosphaera sp.]